MLDDSMKARLRLPAMCAPMFLVSSVPLAIEASKNGVIGGYPRLNVRGLAEFEDALRVISDELALHREINGPTSTAPIAVNIQTGKSREETRAELELCRKYGVEIIISATGDPSQLIALAHDHGLQVFSDITTVRHAEKAIDAGADGLTCIGSGGGGHSGMVSHLALVPKVREMFAGTLVLAGAVSTGAVIRAAEILGADLCSLGTRFIATRESAASEEYKQQIVRGGASSLRFAPLLSKAPANWLRESLLAAGLDPDATDLGVAVDELDGDKKPRPWVDTWSAGQGIELITDVPPARDVIARLRKEYVAACRNEDMSEAASLVDRALEVSDSL